MSNTETKRESNGHPVAGGAVGDNKDGHGAGGGRVRAEARGDNLDKEKRVKHKRKRKLELVVQNDTEDSEHLKETVGELPNVINTCLALNIAWASTEFQRVKYLNKKLLEPGHSSGFLNTAEQNMGLLSDDARMANRHEVRALLKKKFNSMRDYFVQNVKEAVMMMRK